VLFHRREKKCDDVFSSFELLMYSILDKRRKMNQQGFVFE